MLTKALRRVFTFPAMLASVLLVLAVLTVQSRFDDPDLWWNLKTGEVIWTTHTIPVTDLFSYTTNHHAWIPHEWLAQLVIYGAYKFAGFSGLEFLLCLMTATLLIVGYVFCTLYSGNAKVAFLGALVIWLFSTIGLSIRAQMIGYIFLLVELIVIQLGRTRSPRWFAALPVLFAVWVNCHASFIFGLAVGAAYFACSFLNFRAGSILTQRWHPACRRALGLALAGSTAALFINPVGLKLILYPVDTMLHMPVLVGNVHEYAPLQMSDPRGMALMGILLGSFLLVMTRRAKLYWHELLLLAVSTWMAVSHQRMLFVFGILAAPVISRQLAKSWDSYDAKKDLWYANAAFIACALVAVFFAFPNRANLEQQVAEDSPVKAVQYIHDHHLTGNMLNEHQFGGYLMWAAPEHPVFVDGRTDVFEWTGVFREFGNWATLQTDPNTLVDKYNVSFCVLEPDSPMTRVLPMLPNWKVIYTDKNSVIIARTPQTADTTANRSVAAVTEQPQIVRSR